MDPLVAVAFFAFGLAFGSFLNVCIYRMPLRIIARRQIEELESQADPERSAELQAQLAELRGRERSLSVASGRSFCPHCGQQIAWYDNVPLLSWFLLRARCRHCRAPITVRYIVVELAIGLIFLFCYREFGLTFAAAKYCALSFLLFGLIFTDAEHQLLPDALTLPGLAIGLAFSLLVPVNDFVNLSFTFGSVEDYVRPAAMSGISLVQSAFPALVAAGLMYEIREVYFFLRHREGLGEGDIQMMALIGSFLGLARTFVVLFAASLTASVFGLAIMLVIASRRVQRHASRKQSQRATLSRAWNSAVAVYSRHPIPLGVFLGAVALAAAFVGNDVLRWWYLRFT